MSEMTTSTDESKIDIIDLDVSVKCVCFMLFIKY